MRTLIAATALAFVALGFTLGSDFHWGLIALVTVWFAPLVVATVFDRSVIKPHWVR